MKLERVPPVTVTSEAIKVVDASLSVKVRVAVSPTTRLEEVAPVVRTTNPDF